MLASINHYKVKRLLLNGHYVCSSDDGSSYLLCAINLKQSLRNYKHLQFDCIVFPNEITYLSEGEAYGCYPLHGKMSLCMTKLQSKSYTSLQLITLILALCKCLSSSLQHDLLKKEVLSCLCWDNIWMSEESLILMWHPSHGDLVMYREQVLIEKLVQILRMMHIATRVKQKDTNLLKSIVGFTKSKSNITPSLSQFIQYLNELVPTKTVPSLKPNRYTPVRMKRITVKNRYSMERTQSSVDRSLKYIRSFRKKTIDVAESKREVSKLGKRSLFEVIKKTYSPSSSRSKGRSFSKDRITDLIRQQNSTIRTQSSNLQISKLLRTKALQAFEDQKKNSIDASISQPDRFQLNAKGNSWRQKLIKEKEALTASFKQKMRYHKKGEDRIMRLFNSNRQSHKVTLHIDFPSKPSLDIAFSQQRTSSYQVQAKVPYQSVYNSISPKEEYKLIQRAPKFHEPANPKVQRNIFKVEEPEEVDDMKSKEIQTKQAQKAVKVPQKKGQKERPESNVVNKQAPKTKMHRQYESVEVPKKDSVNTVWNEDRKAAQIKNAKEAQLKQASVEDVEEIVLENPKAKKAQTRPTQKTQQSEKKDFTKTNPPVPKLLIPEQRSNTQQSTAKKQDSQTMKNEDSFMSSKKKTSSARTKTQSLQPNDKAVSTVQSQVEEYINFVNLLGEAVSKSQKACRGFVEVEWFTGIYFVYKRFLKERRKIQMWLEDGVREFRRSFQSEIEKDPFQKWLVSESRNSTLKKIKQQNNNIADSIGKMYKSLAKKCINARVLEAAVLSTESPKQSHILVEYVLNQYDDLIEREMTEEIRQHLIEMLDALFIIAQFDNKDLSYHVDYKQRRAFKKPEEYFGNQRKKVEELARAYNVY